MTWLSGGFCRALQKAFGIPRAKVLRRDCTTRSRDLVRLNTGYPAGSSIKTEEYKANARRCLWQTSSSIQMSAVTEFVRQFHDRHRNCEHAADALRYSGLESPQSLLIAPFSVFFCCEVGLEAAKALPQHPFTSTNWPMPVQLR